MAPVAEEAIPASAGGYFGTPPRARQSSRSMNSARPASSQRLMPSLLSSEVSERAVSHQLLPAGAAGFAAAVAPAPGFVGAGFADADFAAPGAVASLRPRSPGPLSRALALSISSMTKQPVTAPSSSATSSDRRTSPAHIPGSSTERERVARRRLLGKIPRGVAAQRSRRELGDRATRGRGRHLR